MNFERITSSLPVWRAKMIRDLRGQRFFRLVVLDLVGIQRTRWQCQCDCGAIVEVEGTNLISKASPTRSCGCWNLEQLSKRKYKHGQSSTYLRRSNRTYHIWAQMRVRCNNVDGPDYPLYGGRGIRVCERWNDYSNFLADMGEAPKGLQLDRVDNNGPYSPDNCKWSTAGEQANNRRSSRLIEYQGRTCTLAEWARETGFKASTIAARLKRGLSVAEAFTEPLSASH